jgi:hypothetical protein
MRQSTYHIELDIEKHETQCCVSLRQGESGRKISAALMSGGRPYDPGEGCYAVFSAMKPDGTHIFNGCTLNGGFVEYTVTAQTTAAAGRLGCEIRIYGGDGELIISPGFAIYVFESVTDEDEISSGSEVTALSELIDTARNALRDGVSYARVQELSEDEKARARENISACANPYDTTGSLGSVSIEASAPGSVRCKIYGMTGQSAEPSPKAAAEINHVDGSISDGAGSFITGELYGLRLGSVIPSTIAAYDLLSEGICDCGTGTAHDYYICDTAENSDELNGERKSRIVRRIGVQTLTGEESVIFSATGPSIVIDLPDAAANSQNLGNPVLCTHFGQLSAVNSISTADDWVIQGSRYTDGEVRRLKIKSTGSWSDAASAKAWLAAQYAAGTPVKVLYLLTVPETSLGEPVPLSTSGGAFTLTYSGDTAPYIGVSYPADVMAMINSLRTAIADLGGGA